MAKTYKFNLSSLNSATTKDAAQKKKLAELSNSVNSFNAKSTVRNNAVNPLTPNVMNNKTITTLNDDGEKVTKLTSTGQKTANTLNPINLPNGTTRDSVTASPKPYTIKPVAKPIVTPLPSKEVALEPKIAKPSITPLLEATASKAGRPVGTNIPAPLAKTTAGAGFQYGVASAFGGKQLGDGAISQNIKAKQLENEKVFNVAKGAGQLAGTAGQYMLANQAVNSAAKVVPLLGNLSKAGKVAATIGTDQLVDNIVRTPQTIIQGKIDNKSGMEIAKDVGKQNVEDLAWNVGMAAGGVVLGKVAEILKKRGKPLADALTDTGIVKEIEEVTGTKQGTPEFNSVVESVSKQTQSPTFVKPTNVAGEVVADVSKQTNVVPDVSIGKTDKTIPTITDSVKTASVKADNDPFELKLDTPKSKPVVELEKQTWTPETGQKTIDDLKEKGFNLFQFSEFKSKAKAVDVDGVKHFEVDGQRYKGNTVEDAYKAYTTLAEKNAKAPKGMKANKLQQTIEDSPFSDQTVKEMIEKDTKFYKTASVEERVKRAKELVDTNEEEAIRIVLSGDRYQSDIEAALGKELIERSQQRGDYKLVGDLIDSLESKATKAGQDIQLNSIWKASTPEGLEYLVQRQINKLNKLGSEAHGKKWTKIELTPAQRKMLAESGGLDGAGKVKLVDEVATQINDQLYAIGWEKWDGWRKIAMLSSPKTHGKNLLGNTTMAVLRKSKDALAEGLEKTAIKKGWMEQSQATKKMGWSKDKELVNVVESAWDENKHMMMRGGKWESGDAQNAIKFMGQQKKLFAANSGKAYKDIPGKALNKWAETVGGLLEGSETDKGIKKIFGDYFWVSTSYKNALGEFMAARGLKEVNEDALEYARQYALEATFRQANAVADGLNKLKRTPVIGRGVDALIPFVKTPANIAKNAIDYSPANLAKYLFPKVRQGATPQKIIDDVAKGLTGTGVIGLGYALAWMGWARGEWKNKASEELAAMAGEQPFSVNTPYGSYTIDWAQPVSISLAIGIAMAEDYKDNPDKLEAIWNAISAGGDTLIEQSMLQNLMKFASSRDTFMTNVTKNILLPYFEQGMPTFIPQVTKSFDDKVRTNYSDTMLGGIINKNAGKVNRGMLEPKVDIWGKEVSSGNTLGRTAQNVISPGVWKSKTDDKVTKEILRLNKSTGSNALIPTIVDGSFTFNYEQYDLKPSEVTKYQKIVGELNRKSYERVINSAEYRNGNDEKKAKLLQSEKTKNWNKVRDQIIKDKGLK